MKESSLTSVFNDRGFTLLEILIAITLLAFISIGVVSVTENAIQTKDRTTEVNKNNLQIETAMSRFEWDFSQIYSPLYFSTQMNISMGDPYGNNPGATIAATTPNPAVTQINPMLQDYYQQLANRFQVNEHFSGLSKESMPIPRFYSPEKNVFEFFTSSNRRKLQNVKQSHFAWVRYALESADQNDKTDEEKAKIPGTAKNLVRYFAPDDPYDDKRINPDDQKVKAAVLLENVESLEFQYWDFGRRKWETSLRAVQQGENLLRGVKIILSWYDSQGNLRKTERIFRNHWPMVVPQDTTATAPTNTTATTGGQPGGATTSNTTSNTTGF